jgi:hypothetical protein
MLALMTLRSSVDAMILSVGNPKLWRYSANTVVSTANCIGSYFCRIFSVIVFASSLTLSNASAYLRPKAGATQERTL